MSKQIEKPEKNATDLGALPLEGTEFLKRILVLSESIKASQDREYDAENTPQRQQDVKETLGALEVENGLQVMLAAQMSAIHELQQRMAYYAKNILPPVQVPSGYVANVAKHYINATTKLSNVFIQQAALLHKLQGKGQQKVTVEHVHVHAGGQAVVGNVEHPQGKIEK